MYDMQNKTPAYPFGYGLSYTNFFYDQSTFKMENQTITMNVTNSGQVFGKEVVQLYIGFPEDSGEPPKQLKGFKKIGLQPGQTQTVKFDLKDRDLSIYDKDAHAWKLQKGNFKIMVGSSSRNIKAQIGLFIQSEDKI